MATRRFPVVSFLALICSLAVPAALAGDLPAAPFRIDEVPSPLDGEFDVDLVSESGRVVGVAERGPDDWVIFVWDRELGKRLLDAGWAGEESLCRPRVINRRGMVAGFLPGGDSPAVPFVWTETLGLEIFPEFPIFPPFNTYRVWLNEVGQLAGGKSEVFVWTAHDGLVTLPQGMGFGDGLVAQNEAGTLLGIVSTFDESSVFVWEREQGVTEFLPSSRSPRTTARLLSDDGWVAGRTLTGPMEYPAYARSPDGEIHTVSLGGDAIDVRAIGRGGMVVGTAEADDYRQYAYAWEPGYGIEKLTLGGEPVAFDIAFDVNQDGLVVGQATTADVESHAFAWKRGQGIVDLTLGGANGFAQDVTESGHVIGRSQDSTGASHLFVWSREMGIEKLSWGGNGAFGFFTGTSDTGSVVGRTPDAAGEMRPFVWTPRTGMRDPSDWLPPLAQGTVSAGTMRPNGIFLVRGDDPVDGRRRVFVFTPAAPPARPETGTPGIEANLGDLIRRVSVARERIQ